MSTMAPELTRRASNTQRVYDWFLSHPWQWVDTRTLELLGGRQAWRTRVSDARVALRHEGLGDIKNRQRRDADGVVCSEYRYEPSQFTVGISASEDTYYSVAATGRLF